MNIDESSIRAEVYKKTDKGIYYVKVNFPGLKMYVNSITVRPSEKYPGQMWVQMPAIKVGFRWIHTIEFSGDSQLQALIHDEALRAVDSFNISNVFPDVENEDLDAALTKAINDLEKGQSP